ncbi:hypothetical protein BD410DRAFT_575606 [Rickenella mellea]|uniref:Uncharacterized protein n=1 Tax=Rickenella mellea TaxID=50990 RepID=A0A4Y7QFT5_9AGAM|nr:hypothetical protein BD410DRAFT_575606 [Rickenella mellea]
MIPHTLFFTFALLFAPSLAGSVQKGGACNQKNNKLLAGSYQFHSDCDSVTFCNSTNLCQLKGCRRDIFPFGYSESSHLPDLCPNDQFCPDEMDACQPLLPVGSPCQLNRDDQCAPPPNFKQLANPRFGMNNNGSVCLNFQCYWANVTANQPCVVENTAYTGYGADGQEFIDIVSRGNCMTGLYCDSQNLVCKQTLALGQSCAADKECDSMNCLGTQVCGTPADAPKHFPIFVYIVVCFGIFGGIFGTLIGLFFVHRRQRDTEREKRMQYWREQVEWSSSLREKRCTHVR